MWKTPEKDSHSGKRENFEPLSPNQLDNLSIDGFISRDNSWYVSSRTPSDLVANVGGISFHLHKHPLLSKCRRINRIISKSPWQSEWSIIEFDDLPGGPEAFKLAAKFCYGIAINLTASNISGLRCAAEYLEMTEDLEEGNLIYKTEAFLSNLVLSYWRDSIVVLKSCEALSPWAEDLQIVRRCSESIAWKACMDPRKIRYWSHTGRPAMITAVLGQSSINPSSTEGSPGENQQAPAADWWFGDVSALRIDHFARVVAAIKMKGMSSRLLGAAIMNYASKWLPDLARQASLDGDGAIRNKGGDQHKMLAGNPGIESMPSTKNQVQRMVIESLITMIPADKDSVSCSFLLRLLRFANMLQVEPAFAMDLEKRIGMQLEQASLPDLLIPSYSETVYDFDLVQRLVDHFLIHEQMEASSSGRESFSSKHDHESSPGRRGSSTAKMRTATLLDSYLAEVSRDRSLSLVKFQLLAGALPESARTCDDGLYQAIDSYLKAHPTLSEPERKRLCRVLDCRKLSTNACAHAARNDRLPLRFIVQILSSKQVKMSNSIADSSLRRSGDPMASTQKQYFGLEGTPLSFRDGLAAAKRDIDRLAFELGDMKAKYADLRSGVVSLQSELERMSLSSRPATHWASGWSSGWKKLSKLIRTAAGIEEAQEEWKRPRRRRNSIS